MTMTITTRRASIPESNADRWRAVVRRDRRADGTFVYAVRTTGVYCRPSCGARRARRANVEFHSTPADAERAGFRACLRCRPDVECSDDAIAKACRLIERSTEAMSGDDLASAVGLSPARFRRTFKSVTGVTPRAYAGAVRAGRVRSALSSDTSVTAAIYAAGFSSSGRFYETIGRRLGMTPTRFRAGGAGETIRFAVGQCSLGAISVAATARGVCSIALGDDANALVRSLQDQFHQAELIGGDERFERLVARVIGFVERPETGLDLPLDVRGTAFQVRVWDALRRIPAGTTLTYAELARRLSQPRATRAVARACASNRIALAIPCHRVVRIDGSLSGYRWGVARKRALLDRERAGGAS